MSTNSEEIINPNEALHIPSWINESYFETILEKEIPNYVKITKFVPVAATAPGDNYTSIMVRVHINVELKDGTSSNVSYILKTTLPPSNSASFLSSLNLFPKELEMYRTILPAFSKLYKEIGIEMQFGPKCVHVEQTPEKCTLVLEDLKQRHFKNIDRLKGFDMAHMTTILRKLAEFHAASVAYYELNGKYNEMFNISFFTEANQPTMAAMAELRNAGYIKAMRAWNMDNVEHYIKIRPSFSQAFEEGKNATEIKYDEFNVLNHGDFWSNNIMFNYQANGDIDETIFVDFQIAKYGKPAQDLWYTIVSSAAPDIKIKEFDDFIRIYHERLGECLKLLNYKKPIPSLKDLHITLLNYGYWGFFTADSVLAVVVLPTDKDACIESLMMPGPEGDEFRFKVYTNPHYVEIMKQLFPFFENKGILSEASS